MFEKHHRFFDGIFVASDLKKSTSKADRRPVWIYHNNLFVGDVIEEIKKHINPEDKTVTLLFNKTSINQQNL